MKVNPGPFVVFFVFLGLRLSETTDWSWVWVTSPLWIGAGITLVAACFAAHRAYKIQKTAAKILRNQTGSFEDFWRSR